MDVFCVSVAFLDGVAPAGFAAGFDFFVEHVFCGNFYNGFAVDFDLVDELGCGVSVREVFEGHRGFVGVDLGGVGCGEDGGLAEDLGFGIHLVKVIMNK